jgi:hypothetical protein
MILKMKDFVECRLGDESIKSTKPSPPPSLSPITTSLLPPSISLTHLCEGWFLCYATSLQENMFNTTGFIATKKIIEVIDNLLHLQAIFRCNSY